MTQRLNELKSEGALKLMLDNRVGFPHGFLCSVAAERVEPLVTIDDETEAVGLALRSIARFEPRLLGGNAEGFSAYVSAQARLWVAHYEYHCCTIMHRLATSQAKAAEWKAKAKVGAHPVVMSLKLEAEIWLMASQVCASEQQLKGQVDSQALSLRSY